MLTATIHRKIFLFSTALLVIGMPVSIFLLSLAQLMLALNWILELDFKRKLEQIRTSKGLLLILSVYVLHIVYLFNTSDFNYALHDLRIKLPLLALPLIYGTSEPMNRREFKFILWLFIGTVLVSSLITAYILLGFSDIDPVDSRYASLFISHIRFSLLVVLSVFTLVYFTLFSDYCNRRYEKIICLIAAIWLICFLVLLRSFTGIIIFLMLSPLAIIWWAFIQSKKKIFIISTILCLTLIIAVVLYGLYSYNRFSVKTIPVATELPKRTPNGNPYQHNLNMEEFENGNPVWAYVSEMELEKAWNERSEFEYTGLDRKGQVLKSTLIRYLTSYGYTKDSVGISKLDAQDVAMIEKGYTNYIFRSKFSLYPRIYELLWEIERYRKSGDPSGHSLAQRIEYLKTGWEIARDNIWWGIGTGDVEQAFNQQYIADDSKLKPEWRRRTHNQFLTFLLTFGIFGFCWILFALIMPGILTQRYKNFYFTIFFLIALLSMLNEDTLETHVGVSFFSFFYSFLLFSTPKAKTE
jgi:hypothetical protein